MKRTGLVRSGKAAALALVCLAVTIVAAPARAADTYPNYAALAANQILGVDYRIRMINRHADLVIATPHGGGIETGTSELVRAIAGEEETGADWSEYRFEGLRLSGNSVLHITSANFDEPWCLWLLTRTPRVVTIHGTSGSTPVTYVGGLDVLVRDRVIAALNQAGFSAEIGTGDVAGTDPENIVNRGMSQAGVQLEISTEQRNRFFGTNTAAQRWNTRNTTFEAYVAAVRAAVAVDTVSIG